MGYYHCSPLANLVLQLIKTVNQKQIDMSVNQTLTKLEVKLTEVINEHIFTEEWSDSEDRQGLKMYFDDTTSEEMAEAAIAIVRAKEEMYRWLTDQGMIKE